MAGAMSIGGLISGIDTAALLEQLSQAARAPIYRLESRKESLQQQSLAWSSFEATLLKLRTSLAQLAAPVGYRLHTADVSHPGLVLASAGSAAVPGTYGFTVQALAQAHQLVTQGYTDTDATEVGSGTITIAVGGNGAVEIAADSLTLAELRDEINRSGAGVTASIISDGAADSPYRLVLTSGASGLAGQIQVNLDLSGGAPPAFDELQAARDAEIQLGSGPGAVTVTSDSNTFTSAIQGVTLTLLAADPAKPVTVTVARDVSAVQSRIEGLVAAYNDLVAFFAEQFSYDADTNQAGALFGDHRLQSLQHDLSRSLTAPVVGLTGRLISLSQLGIRLDSAGMLAVDSAALAEALREGVDDVAAVLAAVGRTTSPRVTYLAGTSSTQSSPPTGWAVEVTQVATRSRVTAGVAQAGPLEASETITVNGVAIALTAGMTQEEIIAAVNALQNRTGVVASATDADGEGSGNHLTLTRVAYGAAFRVSAVSTASNQGGASSGIGAMPVTDQGSAGESGEGTGAPGLDIEGTIGGVACTGAGRRLTAREGGAAGLSLLIAADAPGGYGSVVFTVGAAEATSRACLSAMESARGPIARAQSSLSDTISDIDGEIARLNDLVAREQERLRATFVAMERALARFQSQSQFLASQMSQMQASAPK